MGKKFKAFLIVSIILGSFFYLFIKTMSPPLPQPGTQPIFYSNQCRDDLRLVTLNAINQAKKSIFLVMFGLTDKTIMQALKNKAESSMEMKIYYDERASLMFKLPYKEVVPLKATGLIHQKILTIDNDMVFIGSANMTPSSLLMHDNLIIGMRHPQLASFLNTNAPFYNGKFVGSCGGQNFEMWLLPDKSNKAIGQLKHLLSSATKKIHAAMFTLTHPILVEELIRASKRGVKVTVSLDYKSSIGSSAKALNTLKKADIKINTSSGNQLLHHKLVVIDDRIMITGSANWTMSAFKKNKDCFLILYNLNEEQRKILHKIEKIFGLEAR
jgi:phosphatidylserine/phosphatidylglycerophosphate/cardiolipin synthase-like enzyme